MELVIAILHGFVLTCSIQFYGGSVIHENQRRKMGMQRRKKEWEGREEGEGAVNGPRRARMYSPARESNNERGREREHHGVERRYRSLKINYQSRLSGKAPQLFLDASAAARVRPTEYNGKSALPSLDTCGVWSSWKSMQAREASSFLPTVNIEVKVLYILNTNTLFMLVHNRITQN